MKDVWENMAISILITLLRSAVNDQSQKKWKKPILKVFKEIAKVYGEDDDFKQVMDTGSD